MDLEKLKNIDFQNIDFNKLLETILSKKDWLATAIIGAVTLLIALALTKNFFTQTGQLNTDIASLKQKIETIEQHDGVDSKIKKFLKKMPQALDEDAFATAIADLASSNNVTILSVVPGGKHQEDLYDYVTGAFEIEVKSFQALLYFLKAIENSPFALRIDSCNVSMGANKQNNMGGGMGSGISDKNDPTMSVHIDLTSVQLKK